MSVYLVKGRGWRYDFTLAGNRHTEAWFKTKAEAKRAEQKRKEKLNNPQIIKPKITPIDTAFLDLVNRKLDHTKVYNSKRHYDEFRYMAKRWIRRWGNLSCSEVTPEMIETFILQRGRISPYTANKEIRYLRAVFNFGKKRGLIKVNPTKGLSFLPVEKQVKYLPPEEDIAKVILLADPEAQDYLWTVRDTMGRISEINRLTWDDISLDSKIVTLYTRKKRGGHLTPRLVPLTARLHEIMKRRDHYRDRTKPWVFWHRYWSHKTNGWVEGPYTSRHHLLRGLCARAKVRPFGFHALRHAGASVLDAEGIPVGTIQKILGHENRSTTEIYLHSLDGAEKAAMAVFESATTGTHKGDYQKKSHTKSHTVGRRKHTLKLVKG